jgi:hypothetical protein
MVGAFWKNRRLPNTEPQNIEVNGHSCLTFDIHYSAVRQFAVQSRCYALFLHPSIIPAFQSALDKYQVGS